MKRDQNGPVLSAVFVDYDNIYLSLRRKSEEAAKRFAKDAPLWLRAIENGRLITQTNGIIGDVRRRIVLNRCYGNPVPRRNATDNSTDMNSFPFVRHHFLRAGFEVVDCPPLTAQLKNSSDIRMVMDMRDYLTHDTYFDEFIILSGDADFTPVLHRLRQHARKTVIFANDYTAAPYTAISDGEVREADLITHLLDGRIVVQAEGNEAMLGLATPAAPLHAPVPQHHAPQHHVPIALQPAPTALQPMPPAQPSPDEVRAMIIAEVVAGVRAAAQPMPIEALADRAMRALGRERTIDTRWAGAGTFLDLLRQSLPGDLRMGGEPQNHFVYDPARQIQMPAPVPAAPPIVYERAPEPVAVAVHAPTLATPVRREVPSHAPAAAPYQQPQQPVFAPLPQSRLPAQAENPQAAHAVHATPLQPQPVAQAQRAPAQPPAARHDNSPVQQSISRIHEACQAPPLAPPEYRTLFEVMAQEITANGLGGAQTLAAITQRAQERGLDVRRDDVRFVLEVVSEADPWFEQGASANLFAGRFRNFVVARCRGQGLNLSADELDLIDAWFAGGQMPQHFAERTLSPPAHEPAANQMAVRTAATQASPGAAAAAEPRANRWWSLDEGRKHVAEQRQAAPRAAAEAEDDFPRIIRSRQRG